MAKAYAARLCIILGLLWMGTTAHAQLKNNGAIQGSVLDASTGQRIDFATISLLNAADSSLITGTISNEEGGFLLEEVPTGYFILKVGFIGYHDTTTNVSISAETPYLALEPFGLKPSAMLLQEAEITAEKSLVETHIDKRVFNVEKV